MKMIKMVILLIVGLLVSAQVLSANNSEQDGDEGIAFSCTDKKILEKTETRFTAIKNKAIALDAILCKNILTINGDISDTRSAILSFGKESERLMLEVFSDSVIKNAITEQFDHFENKVLGFKGRIQHNTLPKLDNSLPNKKLYFTNPGMKKGSLIDIATEACKSATGDGVTPKPFSHCFEALTDAGDAFNIYQVSTAKYLPIQNEPKLKYLSNQWNKYLTEARSQTFLDVWFTSVIHDDYYSQDKLVGPKPTQYFLLRPQVVYEYSSNAKKGDKNQIGLAAEWIGVNWWDLKVPFGVSVISVYSDYEEEDSVGHGLLFTVNNSASIGWVKRGDSDGVFVTMDFLKLWKDKSKTLNNYKKDPWAWIR